MSLLPAVLLPLVFCVPLHAQSFSINPASVNDTAHVAFAARTAALEHVAGDEVCFTLTARDTAGNVRRDWSTTGTETILTLRYAGHPATTANTDTSTHAWNADADGCTFARITRNGSELLKVSDDAWTLPASAFDSAGQCRICLIHTRADSGVWIAVSSPVSMTGGQSPLVNFRASTLANFLVEVTTNTAKPDQVFVGRLYEIVVTPRDRYLNLVDSTVHARFTARFPDEFDVHHPGASAVFEQNVDITGLGVYLLCSQVDRLLPRDADLLQWVRCEAAGHPEISGRSNGYEILTHKPDPGALVRPPDRSTIKLWNSTGQSETFEWGPPSGGDPYTRVRRSRFSPELYSDTVVYTVVLMDSLTLTHSVRTTSDAGGIDKRLSRTHRQIADLVVALMGSHSRTFSMIWYVEASDGLYTGLSSPPFSDPTSRPGYRCEFVVEDLQDVGQAAPARELVFEQNFPNPFAASTIVRFSLSDPGSVTLRVYDIMGGEAAVIMNGEYCSAGTHAVRFDAAALPAGVYVCALTFAGRTLTRRITLMK